MRRILFRAKIIHNDVWIYGLPEMSKADGSDIIDSIAGEYIKTDTLTQFINLYDDAKRLIFEEDIIETIWENGEQIILIPKWSEKDNAIEFVKTNGKFYCGMIPFLRAVKSKNVIGNTIDDPDMLVDIVE